MIKCVLGLIVFVICLCTYQNLDLSFPGDLIGGIIVGYIGFLVIAVVHPKANSTKER